MGDSHVRSAAKGITYRVFGSLATMVISYAFTGDWKISSGIGAADLFVKIGLFYVHERAWEKISFGRTSQGYSLREKESRLPEL